MWCLRVLLQTAEWASPSGRQDGKQPPSEYTVTEAVDYIGSLMVHTAMPGILYAWPIQATCMFYVTALCFFL